MMPPEIERVPRRPTLCEWDLSGMEANRRHDLENAGAFEDIARRIAKGATPVRALHEPCADPKAPPETVRACFRMLVDRADADALYNAPTGLRAQYWLSPERGEAATRHLLSLLRATLLSERLSRLVGQRRMDEEAVSRAFDFPSAKVWVPEEELRLDGEGLSVERWVANENEPDNPRMWRWTPRASTIEIKSGWLCPDGEEFVVEWKKDRAQHIHRWGYS